MHIESYNCIGEENKKKFYAKLKELENEVAKNPGHWGPELELDAFRQFGEVYVFDDVDEKEIKGARKMSIDVGKKVNALEKKRDAELKKIKSSYDAKIKAVIADYKKDDTYGDYKLKFDLKKKCVVSDEYGFVHNCKPCNRWSKKSDWFIVEIEDYEVCTTYTDCGYGDCDEHAMFRVISRYEVCPNCGRMIRLSTEKFESGKSKTRWEDSTGFDIRPLHWTPRVKIIKKSK